jgi:hypothetical protein
MIAFFGENWAYNKRGINITSICRGEEAKNIWIEQWTAEFGTRRGVSVGEALRFTRSDNCSPGLANAIIAACRETI